MTKFDSGNYAVCGDFHVGAEHFHELLAGHVREAFTDRFGLTVVPIHDHAVELFKSDGNDFDHAQANDLFAGFQAHAFAAGHEAVTSLEKLPTKPPGDVFGFVQKLLFREAEGYVSHGSSAMAPQLAHAVPGLTDTDSQTVH